MMMVAAPGHSPHHHSPPVRLVLAEHVADVLAQKVALGHRRRQERAPACVLGAKERRRH